MNFLYKYRILYFLVVTSLPASIIIGALLDMWWWVLFSILYGKFINFLGIQVSIHRYMSHNGFKTGPIRHKFLVIASLLTGQGSPISWSTHHIHHHRYSDTQKDLHSPDVGFWHTILWWPVSKKSYFDNEKQIGFAPKHLVRDPFIMWIHKNYFTIWTLLIVVSTIIDWRICLFFILAPAGFSLFNANIVTNYLSHIKLPGSYRNFETSDHSYNNKWVQVWQIGEGLHNNHHKDSNAYNQAMAPGEKDPAAWVIDKFLKVN